MLSVAVPMLLLLLADLGEAGGPPPIKLCGRDLMHLVVYTCGGSRWKREGGLVQYLKAAGGVDQSLFLDGLSNYEDWAQDSGPSVSLSDDELSRRQAGQQPDSLGWFWNSDRERRDLREVCCKRGCTKRQISSLC